MTSSVQEAFGRLLDSQYFGLSMRGACIGLATADNSGGGTVLGVRSEVRSSFAI